MLGWFRALMPREDRFFDLFSRHSRIVVEGAEALEALLEGGPAAISHGERIVQLEQQADGITREVLLAVRKSFITPFDRSDITDLIQSMDDSVDRMQQLVKTVTLYGQDSFAPNMKEMGRAIHEAATLMDEAIPLLSRVGTNSTRLGQLTEAIVHVEERADGLHDSGLRSLYQEFGKPNPMAYMIGKAIYDNLEGVVDSIEDVANEISGIMLENL